MAAVKGVNITKWDAGAQGDNDIDQGLIKTNEKVWYDEYEASALAIASTIDIAELPTGAKVMGIDLYCDSLGASSTLDIGDSNDTDRYTTAALAVGTTAGKYSADAADGIGYVIGTNSGDNRIQILTAGAAITGTIKSVVRYTL